MMKRLIVFALTVMFMATGSYAAVSDHILKIEISTTYDYELPEEPLSYEFDAWINVDDTVVSGSLQVPDSNVYPLLFDDEESDEIWLGFHVHDPNQSVLDDFGAGTYTFTVNYNGGGSDSTSVDYTLTNGQPIPYVTQEPHFIYPQNNDVNVPCHLTLQFDQAVDPNWTISIDIDPWDEGLEVLSCEVGGLPYDTDSYGPVTLSPGTFYDIEYSINNVLRIDNVDGIPAVLDTDAECDLRFTTAEDMISNHVYNISIENEWDYNDPGGLMTYDFEMQIHTDDTVESIDILTPAGNTYNIPNITEQCIGPVCTYYQTRSYGIVKWIYYARFSNPSPLENYGDGLYTLTVHYIGETQDQTTAWFGVPCTLNPIPQPKIQPIRISPAHLSTVSSPVTFTWESCLDANATKIWVYADNEDNGDEVGMPFPITATSWNNVVMSSGYWDSGLTFDNSFQTLDNGDGISVEVTKCSTTDYHFTVTGNYDIRCDFDSSGVIDLADFVVFARSWLGEL